jgi:hypothetical protein
MKTPGFTLFLMMIMVILQNELLSQTYNNLVVENSQWQIMQDDESTPWEDNMYGYVLRGDTVINDLTYKKLFKRSFEAPQVYLITEQWLCGFLREDVENEKVYVIEWGWGGCDSSNAEYLLFDFSLDVGDTSGMCIHTEYIGLSTLESKVSEFIYEKDRNIYNFGQTSVELIEGIGSFNGLLESPVINVSGGVSSYLWDYCRGTDEECGVLYVGISELHKNNMIMVYPNPTKDHVTVSLSIFNPSKLGKLHVILFNSIGKEMDRIEVFSDCTAIDLNLIKYPNGLYMIALEMDNKIVCSKKLEKV